MIWLSAGFDGSLGFDVQVLKKSFLCKRNPPQQPHNDTLNVLVFSTGSNVTAQVGSLCFGAIFAL